MNRRIGLYGRIGKEVVAAVLPYQEREFIVTAADFATAYETPLAHMNPTDGIIHAPVCERIAVNYVLGEDVSGGLNAFILAFGFKKCLVLLCEIIKQALTARGYIIGQ